jgi:hypothetical protein
LLLINTLGKLFAYNLDGKAQDAKKNPRIMGPHNPGKSKRHPGEFNCQPTERTAWNGLN